MNSNPPADEILFEDRGMIFVKYNYNHPYHPRKPATKALLVKSQSLRDFYFWITCSDPNFDPEKLVSKKVAVESPNPKRRVGELAESEHELEPGQKRRKVD
jgi:hypothetical protein